MMIQSGYTRRRRRLIGALLAGAAALLSYGEYAAAEQPAIPPAAKLASWFDNGHGGRYVLQIAQGRSLGTGERVLGVVKTDTNCDPDAQGLNHCRNAIELSNGGVITVINTHQMMRNRCLGPGDRLSLSGIGARWVMASLSSR